MHNILSFHCSGLPEIIQSNPDEMNSLHFTYQGQNIGSLFIFCDSENNHNYISSCLLIFIKILKTKEVLVNFSCSESKPLLFFIQFIYNDEKYVYQFGYDGELIEESLWSILQNKEIFYSDSRTVDLPDEYIQAITNRVIYQHEDVQSTNCELFNRVSEVIDSHYSKMFIMDNMIGDNIYKLINIVTYAIETNGLLVLNDLSFLHYNSIVQLMELAVNNTKFGLLFGTTNIGLLATNNIKHEHIVLQDDYKLVNLTAFENISGKNAYDLIRCGRVGGVPFINSTSVYNICNFIKKLK